MERLYKQYLKTPIISIDTREIVPNCLFFCIRGENFDGNDFVGEALAKGAALVVTENPDFKNNPQCLYVANSLETLQALSAYHRSQLSLPIIGITGSNGKTTTKELLVAVLSQKYKVAYTKGNLNNHIGVPLTLLSIHADDNIAVVEMGANHVGEIAQLCKWVRPNFGLITNIEMAHLEGFDSFDNIVNTKNALYEAVIKNSGTIFINKNDNLLISLINNYPDIIYYKSLSKYDKKNRSTLNLTFQYNEKEVVTHLTGDYNLINIAAAIQIGIFFNVNDNAIIKAISNYIPTNYRSQIINQGTNIIIADFYNANPSSMTAAISNFKEQNFKQKLAILGEMRELGKISLEEHKKVIDYCKNLKLKVFFVGEEFCKHSPDYCFKNVSELNQFLKLNLIENHLILIKGSRGVYLENVEI